jgi:hypothetical protein
MSERGLRLSKAMEYGSWKASPDVLKKRNIIIIIIVIIIIIRTGQSGVRIPEGARDFSLLKNVQAGSGTRPAPYTMRTAVPSGG